MLLNNKIFFYLLLSLPMVKLLYQWGMADIDVMDIIGPSGEWSARFIIIAMMIGPFAAIINGRIWSQRFGKWLLLRRRYVGVAAFIYAAIHLIFYIIDMGDLDEIIYEFSIASIWTAWVAFLIIIPLAITSNDYAMRRLKANWLRLQRLVYPLAIFTLLHWMWVHNSMLEALIYFTPLLVLHIIRLQQKLFKRTTIGV